MSVESTGQSQSEARIDCPRCGYDVTVLRPNEWAGKTGTCPECGYGLDWTLIDTQPALLWHIEATGDEQGLWRRWAKTFVRVVRIKPFFADVRLEKPVVLRRAFLWALMLFIVIQVLFGTVMVARRMATFVPVPPSPPPKGMSVRPIVPQEDAVGWIVSEYTAPIFVVSIEQVGGWPPTMEWKEMWEYVGGTWSCNFLISSSSLCFVNAGPGLWILPVRILWAVVLSTPMVLMCLPWTRQQAKVRPLHVLRATIYSVAAFVPLVIARLVIEVILPPYGGSQLSVSGGFAGFDVMSNFWLVLATIASMVWLWFWWRGVFRDHWKLTHAWAVWATVIVVQCLLVAIFLAFMFNRWIPYTWII